MLRNEIGTSSSEFLWAVGIENTFVPQTRSGHRPLDEYELMDHYRLWRGDLDKAADLGISAIRYGIPWYKVAPTPKKFDWSWTDQVMEYLVEAKGLTPIVDLMHYGTPSWLDNGFLNASYPRRVADYAWAFAERYSPLVKFYTPLNEPGVTALYCGREGRWPPYLSGDDGFVKILLALSKGMARTAEALRSVRPDTILVHVEDVGIERPGSPALAEEAAALQAMRLLPLDLACGKVVAGHPMYESMLEHGAEEAELHALAASMPRWDVLGVNYYPWSTHHWVRRRNGALAKVNDERSSGLGEALRMVHGRYNLPIMLTETSSPGSHMERARWMGETLAEVRAAREGGVPIIGYTWFPMFTMIDWKYRWSRKGMNDHLLHLGLWDVIPEGERLEREPTLLVENFRGAIADPVATIGAWPETPAFSPLPQLVA